MSEQGARVRVGRVVYPGWWGAGCTRETRTDRGGDECIYGGVRQGQVGQGQARTVPELVPELVLISAISSARTSTN